MSFLPMSRDVICVSPDDSLIDSKKLMDDWQIRHLPVVVGRRVVGIISDRDILLRSSLRQNGKIGVENIRVQSVMTPNPVMCNESESLINISTLMADKKISSVLVVDKKRHILGIITSSDIIDQFCKQQNRPSPALSDKFNFRDDEMFGIGLLE